MPTSRMQRTSERFVSLHVTRTCCSRVSTGDAERLGIDPAELTDLRPDARRALAFLGGQNFDVCVEF